MMVDARMQADGAMRLQVVPGDARPEWDVVLDPVEVIELFGALGRAMEARA